MGKFVLLTTVPERIILKRFPVTSCCVSVTGSEEKSSKWDAEQKHDSFLTALAFDIF